MSLKLSCQLFPFYSNLIKVRPLFSLSRNSPLLFVFSAFYIDQSIVTFIRMKVFKLWSFDLSRLHARGDTKNGTTKQQNDLHHFKKYCTALKIRYLIGRNHDAIYKLQSSYKVQLNPISNGELSDPLCDMWVAISSELFPHSNLLQVYFDVLLHLTSRTSCDVKQWSLTYCVFVDSEGSWSHFCGTISLQTPGILLQMLIAMLFKSLSHLIPFLLEFEAIIWDSFNFSCFSDRCGTSIFNFKKGSSSVP